MACANCLDAWDDCFNFFKGKSPYHTTRQTKLSQFTRNQRVGWKLMGAFGIFIFCVFFQCLLLEWEGHFSDGREKIPPLMLFGPMSAMYSVIAMWIAAVHLYQPTFNGPRILLHYRRPSTCSWEILDWVFFEGSTTSTVVAFIFFWMVTLPYSDIPSPGLHVLVFWIFMQYLWVISGHQPSTDLFNFHSPASPVSTLMLFLGTVLVFFILLWYSKYLQYVSDKAAEATAGTGDIDSDENSSILTPVCEKSSNAPFGLVTDSSADNCLSYNVKSPIDVDHHKSPLR
ncbi:unnamed protein product [Peronospora belbahrii]|uniref:Uncharacterized protein n=1 Tax=Peronospora belbahrii TaxID=622444 RepID=A0AAU9KWE1_9STRA|nr:unnamed protein product [Peronospora belbahrii]